MIQKALSVSLIAVARLAANYLIFIIPVPWAIIIIYCLDSIDGPIYKHVLHTNPLYAQYYDKFLDYVYYVALILVVFRDNLAVWPLLFALFAYRTIGQILFFITGKKEVFVYFINFFEFFVLGIYILHDINPNLVTYELNYILPLFSFIAVYKVWVELFLHHNKFTFFDNMLIPSMKRVAKAFLGK